MTHAVVTGGGTSGHVLPALAIMDRLVAAGHDPGELHYIGTDRGIETRLLPPTGYGHTFLDVIGLQRALTRRNLAVVPKLIRATRRAGRLLGELRPAVVVNVGGYASMPATLAAFRAKIPVVVVSYDLRPGLVSKLAARRATAVAAAFAASPLPDTRLTGAPIRPEIIAVDRIAGRAAARAELDLPDDRFVVAVFGGSLGAKAINTAVAGLVAAWEADGSGSDVCIHHVVGDRWLVEAPPSRDGRAGIMYRVIGYEDRMPQLYAAADLMITRRREHDRRARRHRHTGHRGALARCRREPPARQRPHAHRHRCRRAARGSPSCRPPRSPRSSARCTTTRLACVRSAPRPGPRASGTAAIPSSG
ncbi:MAG: glycosyltransferase [Ilumatobacteraceae bacterium]